MTRPRTPGRRSVLAGGLAGLGTLAGCSASGATAARTVSPPPPATASPRVAATPAGPKPPALRFGINYTPSSVWWTGLWKTFDAHRVQDDLAAIASLGVDHIRIQLLWNVFQPTITGAATRPLSNLATLLDLAADHKLDVCPSVVTASLSGKHYTPGWASGRNWVTEPDLVLAQVRYLRDLGRAIGAHPRLLGFDLGNENLGQAPDTSSTHLRAWATRLMHECRLAAPGRTHTVSPNGIFTAPYPEIISTVGDVSVIHPWVFLAGVGKGTGSLAQGGTLEHAGTHHAEFNIEHIRSYHPYTGPRRRVWVQEMGAPRINFLSQPVIPPALSADFVEQAMLAALSCEDLWGVTWWCSHDLDSRKLPGFHPPEYTLGLFDLSGRPKPTATQLASVIARQRAGRLPAVTPRHHAIVGSDANRFDRASVAGELPAIVQPAHAHDAAYLARRGITTLL